MLVPLSEREGGSKLRQAMASMPNMSAALLRHLLLVDPGMNLFTSHKRRHALLLLGETLFLVNQRQLSLASNNNNNFKISWTNLQNWSGTFRNGPDTEHVCVKKLWHSGGREGGIPNPEVLPRDPTFTWDLVQRCTKTNQYISTPIWLCY